MKGSRNPHDFNVGKPNILVPLNLAITYRNEVIAVVRIANIVRLFEWKGFPTLMTLMRVNLIF